jgi:tripartite-type tricarboxylate transporter receptor subunit TctC
MKAGRFALLGLALFLSGAQAQTLPKQITLVVPYPPGSTSDLIPRMVAPHLQQILGSTVIVENVAGANGAIGAQRVARGPADGSQILMAPTGVLSANQFLYTNLSYDPEKSFDPLINLAGTPNLIVVNKNVPANTMSELIKLAEAKPGTVSFGSGGVGSTSHLCGEMVKLAAKGSMIHVPFRGPAPAKQAVLAGDVTFICDNFSNVIEDTKEGGLKAIALSAKTRHPQAPNIPTTADQGYPAIDAGIWYSFVVPRGTPSDLVNRLNAEIAKILAMPDVKPRLEALGLSIIADSPQSFGTFLKSETARWKKAIEEANIKIEQ